MASIALAWPQPIFADFSCLGTCSLQLIFMSSNLRTRHNLLSCLSTFRNRNWGLDRKSVEARRSSSSKADRPAVFIGGTRGFSVPKVSIPCWPGTRISRLLPRRPLKNDPSSSVATPEASADPHRDDRCLVMGSLMRTTRNRIRHTIPQRRSASLAQDTSKTYRDVHLQVGDFRQISRSPHNEAYRLPSRPLAQARRVSTIGTNNQGTTAIS